MTACGQAGWGFASKIDNIEHRCDDEVFPDARHDRATQEERFGQRMSLPFALPGTVVLILTPDRVIAVWGPTAGYS